MTEKDQYAFNLYLLQCVHENAKVLHALSKKVDIHERPDLQKEIEEAQARYFNNFESCVKVLEKAKQ